MTKAKALQRCTSHHHHYRVIFIPITTVNLVTTHLEIADDGHARVETKPRGKRGAVDVRGQSLNCPGGLEERLSGSLLCSICGHIKSYPV